MDRVNIDVMYDKLTEIYFDLEEIMERLYYDLQNEPTNLKNANRLQEIGNVAIKVLGSQIHLIESYGDPQFKDNLLNNLDDKLTNLSASLALDRDRFR